MRKFRYIAVFALLALAAGAMFGTSHSAAQAGNLFIRVAHVTPGIAAQDVYVDSNKVLTAVAYKQVSDYLSITAGHHVIKVTDTGTAQGASLDATFDAGKHITIFAYPAIVKAGVNPPQYRPGLAQLEDDFRPLVAGKARISVSNFSPDAGSLVSVVISGTSGSSLVAEKEAPFGRSTDYTEADAGTYSVEIRDAQGNPITTTNNLSVASGKVYDLAVIGLAKGSPALELLPVVASVSASSAAPTATAAAAPPTAAPVITPTAVPAVTATATTAPAQPPTATAMPPAPTPTVAKATPTAVKVIAPPPTTPVAQPTAKPSMPGMPRTGGGGFDPLWLLLIAAAIIGVGLSSRRWSRTHPLN